MLEIIVGSEIEFFVFSARFPCFKRHKKAILSMWREENVKARR